MCCKRDVKLQLTNYNSPLVNVISGVPQGSVFGPALFVCYINDMPESVSPFLFMYADDSKVGRQILCKADCLALQSDLDNICVLPKNWQLRFNLDKCKILRLGKCNVMRQYSMQDDSGQKTVLQDTVEEKDHGICQSGWILY